MRILSRRYNLTRTGYKFLEIGIGIPPTADAVAVHIVLGDTTSKEILLTPEMWKGLVDSRAIICDNLARANGEHGPSPPMQLGDLTVRFATINSQPTIRLDTPFGRLTLSAPTVRFLYGFRHCVQRVIATMTVVVGRAEAKLRAFRHIAAGVEDPSSALRAISGSADFDRNDLLDCELLIMEVVQEELRDIRRELREMKQKIQGEIVDLGAGGTTQRNYSNIVKEKAKESIIIVKPEVQQGSEDTKKVIKEKINIKNIAVGITKMRKGNKGTVVLGCETGEEIETLKNTVQEKLAVTDDNFNRAWETLVTRYCNKRVLVCSYLDLMFGIKPLSRKSADDLKELLATVNEALGGLRSLEVPIDTWNYFLVHFMVGRLDIDSREAWELQQGAITEPATFAELEEFLDGRTRALEMITQTTSDQTSRPAKPSTKAKPTARAHAAITSSSKCALCNEEHYIARCPGFSAKSVTDRREIVNAKRLCFNCLGAHKLSECRTLKRCRICQGQHHTLIHIATLNSTPHSSITAPTTSSTPHSGATASSDASAATSLHASTKVDTYRSSTLLPTAQVNIFSDHGSRMSARALLDSGSELSFVPESLAQILQLSRKAAAIPILGIGSRSVGFTRGDVSLRLQSRVEPRFELDVVAHVMPSLTDRIPATPLSTENWRHTQPLALADPSFAIPGKVDIILGANVIGPLLTPPSDLPPPILVQGTDEQPTAQYTRLGWILFGPTGSRPQSITNSPHPQSYNGVPDHELKDILCKFWAQDEIPDTKRKALTPEEEQCEQHFLETHTRTMSGRYVIRLPFRSPGPGFGSSYVTATRTLSQLQHRLSRNSTLSRLYTEFINEYESLGHMSRLPEHSSVEPPAYFLPHHGVFRETSSTTRLRVVFNGSSQTTNGASLNDCLLVGPKLQTEIFNVIIRWQLYAYAFTADISKMYRQILVHPDDRVYQRILWSISGAPVIYELNTVTYGLTCSPFNAIRIVRQLATDEGSRYPLAADVLLRDMYVDDVLSGDETISRAKEKAQQVDRIFMAGGFSLHKWSSNKPAVLDDIPSDRQTTDSSRELASDALSRALGLSWRPSDDSFVIRVQFTAPSTRITKRSVLSKIAQIYDPLGWITPVTIIAKMLIQDLWRLGRDWDEELPDTDGRRWKELPAHDDARTFSGQGTGQSTVSVAIPSATHAPILGTMAKGVPPEATGHIQVANVLAVDLHRAAGPP
ncbi:hypothetical protein DMN91_004257 [Ooceraea biroi]|uniref:Uncharacterized protein n=1 Tax=Ooceraea biroi TaxID=2015173 RepID=A0A3L8DW93_OOCBI|nr:hypothetical protein DMN91_004257 [Ooceraea biroi]